MKESSFVRKSARNGIFFAAIKFVTQLFSWGITVLIARILVPEDYGLMSMASILTGYAAIFSELGLGAAIIQKKEVNQEILSSVFWFGLFVGIFFAIATVGLAYPTAWIFDEPRLIPITQLISVIFIISGLMIVPINLLSREVRFKELGITHLIAVVISSLLMLWMAQRGFGVWTLINGALIKRFVRALVTLYFCRWKPAVHFQFREITALMKFGFQMTGSDSLFYIFQKADKYIVGKLFKAQYLGYYEFAMQLASIPTDKIVSIIQQVSFPTLSKYQDNLEFCKTLYLKITKYTALIVSPLFLGGAFFAEDLILTVLGPKWAPIIFVFRMLCGMQFIVSITVINNVLHNAMGRPLWTLRFQFLSTAIMPLSIFFAARQGFDLVVIPWVTIYPVICFAWIGITLKKLAIPLIDYLKVFVVPFFATLLMTLGGRMVHLLFNTVYISEDLEVLLAQKILIGALFYLVFLFLFERKTFSELWGLRKV